MNVGSQSPPFGWHVSLIHRSAGTTMSQRFPTYVSLDEAAEIMSLSVKTIRRRIADGTIPAYQCGRRPIRIRLDELESALRRIPTARS